MSYLRDIDRWFIAEVLPHEAAYLARGRRFCPTGEEANDLVQESYARLLTLETWRTLANPRAYVLTMVQNLAIQRLRHARVVDIRQVASLDALDLTDDAPDALQDLIGRDQLRRLLAAVDQLPARCRDVVVMRRFEERPPREIARRLGVSLSTLEKRLARGMVLLVQAMEASAKTAASSSPHAKARKAKRNAKR